MSWKFWKNWTKNPSAKKKSTPTDAITSPSSPEAQSSRRTVPRSTSIGTRGAPPEVLVDFVFQDGLFFITIRNLNPEPVYHVSIQFTPDIRGGWAPKTISEIPVFQRIDVLAPDKVITIFLDTAAQYFARNEPTRIEVTVTHHNFIGQATTSTITHNLDIYRYIPYVSRLYRPIEPSPASLVSSAIPTEDPLTPLPPDNASQTLTKRIPDADSFRVTHHVTEERFDSE